jgi:two-component system, OmpR family, phosphate regulon response regulator PhoB
MIGRSVSPARDPDVRKERMSVILIIEDEKDILDLVEYQLKQAGFQVITARDGGAGLEQAVKGHPDLIILDLMLPTIDGKDVCRSLKSNPITQAVPVLMLTAKADEVDRVIGFELGADDYVTKPFSPRELILRIKAILRRRVPDAPGVKVIRIGDLLIDLDRHQVSIKDKAVSLTSTEFKLLVELASKRGRVQSRQGLLDRVWGYNCEGYDRTVDTHIRRLREKLGDMADYIETLRGVGYRFREKEA